MDNLIEVKKFRSGSVRISRSGSLSVVSPHYAEYYVKTKGQTKKSLEEEKRLSEFRSSLKFISNKEPGSTWDETEEREVKEKVLDFISERESEYKDNLLGSWTKAKILRNLNDLLPARLLSPAIANSEEIPSFIEDQQFSFDENDTIEDLFLSEAKKFGGAEALDRADELVLFPKDLLHFDNILTSIGTIISFEDLFNRLGVETKVGGPFDLTVNLKGLKSHISLNDFLDIVRDVADCFFEKNFGPDDPLARRIIPLMLKVDRRDWPFYGISILVAGEANLMFLSKRKVREIKMPRNKVTIPLQKIATEEVLPYMAFSYDKITSSDTFMEVFSILKDSIKLKREIKDDVIISTDPSKVWKIPIYIGGSPLTPKSLRDLSISPSVIVSRKPSLTGILYSSDSFSLLDFDPLTEAFSLINKSFGRSSLGPILDLLAMT